MSALNTALPAIPCGVALQRVDVKHPDSGFRVLKKPEARSLHRTCTYKLRRGQALVLGFHSRAYIESLDSIYVRACGTNAGRGDDQPGCVRRRLRIADCGLGLWIRV